MRKLLIASVIMFPSLALAQPAQQTNMPFEPYSINEQLHKDIMDHLLEMPGKYGIPFINTFQQLEQQAQMKAKIEADKKAAEAKKTVDEKKPLPLAKPSEPNKTNEPKK